MPSKRPGFLGVRSSVTRRLLRASEPKQKQTFVKVNHIVLASCGVVVDSIFIFRFQPMTPNSDTYIKVNNLLLFLL